MARKKKPEEHENHERWLVSYADFITLLFAFFVVMYALSSVNEGKYRVLSDSLISAFDKAPQSLQPIQQGVPIKAPAKIIPDNRPTLKALPDNGSGQAQGKGNTKDRQNLDKIQDKLEKSLGGMIEQELISVKRTGRGLEVEIDTAILFDSGKALIQARAVTALTDIATSIKNFPNAVLVEGFTDNVPIQTSIYPSNWELSASRAASVVHLFSDEGVDPFRMSATGYGEYRPVAANTTAEGRKRNRRVVVVIMSEAASKNQYDQGQVIEITTETRRSQNIDLDEPPPLIEVPVMGIEADVPEEGFPEDLPLRGRGSDEVSQDDQDQLERMLETIEDNDAVEGEAQ